MPDLEPFNNQSAEHLRLVLENSQIGIWELDIDSELAVRNETHDRIFGYDEPLPEWRYDQFLKHIVEDDRARVDELQKIAIEEGREWSFECQIKTKKGHFRWITAAGRPLKDSEGKTIRLIGHVIDITKSKQSEFRLRIITEELNHRVRNLLAMIKAMVKMTARGANDIRGFSKALEGRVGALARAQDLLVGNSSASMLPSLILGAEVAPFEGIENRITISVDDEAELSVSASQGLALVFHELITNAVKYGALSTESGKINVHIDCAKNTVSIVWKEHGGPPLDEVRNSGFGSQLISKALAAEGTTEQLFLPEGLETRIDIVVS